MSANTHTENNSSTHDIFEFFEQNNNTSVTIEEVATP